MSSSSFQDTRWTLVERTRGSSPESRQALSELCAACHRPVHAFIRSWCRDEEQARDLSQEFFARLLARPMLDQVERGRGRFRSYLLGAIKHFLCEADLAARTLKRGGGARHESLHAEGEDSRAPAMQIADSQTLPPDVVFDQQWACALLERALEKLRAELDASGKAAVYETLKPWLAGTADHGDQQKAALALSVNVTAVRVQVHRLRRRYRELIESEVAQTLTPGASLAEEMQHLLAAVAGR